MWGAPQPSSTAEALRPPAGSSLAPESSPAADRSSNYLPGYLSRIKDSRSYSSQLHGSSPLAASESRDDPGNDSVSLLVPRRQSNVLAPSPQSTLNSSFFQPRSSTRLNESFTSNGGNNSLFGNSSVGGNSFGPNSPAARGRQSAFGPSGLRSRPGPANGPGQSMDTRSPSVSFSAHRGPVSTSPGDDDDIPPPVQSLDDEDAIDTSNATAPASARTAAAGQSSLLGSNSLVASKSSSLMAPGRGAADDMKLRTVCLYGFPRSLEGLVMDHFGLGLVSFEWVPFNQSDDGPGCVEAVYSDANSALRALRRSGELVAGAALVGVRVKDDALQHALLLDGLSGTVTSESPRPSASTPDPLSSGVASTPQRPQARPRASVGRPLSVIGTRDSALAPQSADTSSSLLRFPGWSTPQAQDTELPSMPRSSSFLGRVGDAVFGW